jgi:hypothetical protein
MTEAEAITLLGTYGVDPSSITSTDRYSNSVDVGDVVAISPAVGTLVPPDQTFTLFISIGPAPASRWTGATDPVTGAAIKEIAAAEQEVVPVVFAHLEMDGADLYFNNSSVTFPWDDNLWIGAGHMGDIEAVQEAQDLIAQPVRLTISGIDADVIQDAMNANYKDGAVTLYLALLNHDTLEIIDEPEELWSGFMDVMTIEADQNSGSISVVCEHWLRVAPVISLYTDQEQQVIDVGDRFFQFTKDIPNYVGNWGGQSLSYGGGGGGGGTRGPVRNKH